MVKAYDPTFYTAYNLDGGVSVDGPCAVEVLPADLDAAFTQVEELLYARPSSDFEEDYPAVGESFADTVTVKCAD